MAELKKAVQHSVPAPLAIVLNFPANPTAQIVDLDFYGEIVDFCRRHDIVVLSDLAYAEIYFDGKPPPSILEVPGARDIAVEFSSLSKTYSMAGWRIGFAVGNQRLIAALSRVKSYLDYGAFTPIQVAATAALNGPQDCIGEIRERYQARRDVLVDGLRQAGWEVPQPAATMFAWAPIPTRLSRDRQPGLFQAAARARQCRGVAGGRLRRIRRRLCPHRAGREPAAPAPGDAQHQNLPVGPQRHPRPAPRRKRAHGGGVVTYHPLQRSARPHSHSAR